MSTASSLGLGVDLDIATRVHSTGRGYIAYLSEDWAIWGPNGGYLALIALRAAGMQCDILRPSSIYCHFLSSPKFDEVQIRVDVLKKGRRAESVSVRMIQSERPVLVALVRTANEAAGYRHQTLEVPHVPDPLALESYETLGIRPSYKFWDNMEVRPTVPKILTAKREGISRDWVRFRPAATFSDPFLDAGRSLILLDTFGWPAVHRLYPDGQYFAPNLDTAVWFHGFRPDSEWLLVDQQASVGSDGLLGVHGNVWDTNGKLLATGSAHLCCLAHPPKISATDNAQRAT